MTMLRVLVLSAVVAGCATVHPGPPPPPLPGQASEADRALYESSRQRFEAGDFTAALSGWKTGCEAGLSDACHGVGIIVDEQSSTGEIASRPWFEKACRLGSGPGCAMMGLKAQFGRGAEPDPVEAHRYFRLACDLGEAKVGCFNLGLALIQKSDDDATCQLALPLFQQACRAGSATGCYDAALLLRRDPAQAAERQRWLLQGCDFEDALCCIELAQEVEATDPARAEMLRKAACEYGASAACKP